MNNNERPAFDSGKRSDESEESTPFFGGAYNEPDSFDVPIRKGKVERPDAQRLSQLRSELTVEENLKRRKEFEPVIEPEQPFIPKEEQLNRNKRGEGFMGFFRRLR